MDIKTTRKINLQKAIKICGTAADLSSRIGAAASYLSSIQNPRHRANVGDKLARKIEQAIDTEKGWMDVSHPSSDKIDTSKEAQEQAQKYIQLLQQLNQEQRNEVLTIIDMMARKRKILDKYR